MAIDSSIITQIAILVDDINATAKNYAELFGVPMPEIVKIPPSTEIPSYYRGKQIDASGCLLCVFDVGNTVLELVQPDLTRPNSWKDAYDRMGGPGVQHIGFVVKDREGTLKQLEDMGADAYHVGYYPDMSYTFVDGRKQFGVEFNIKKFGLDNKGLMQKMKEAPDKTLEEITGA